MPTELDSHLLEGVAVLLRDACTLYQNALPHIHDEAVRDEICGLIAVRRALQLRLQDLMEELRMEAPAVHGAPGAVDVQSMVLHRHLAQGDLAAALREIDAWDAIMRGHVRRHTLRPGLSEAVADNLTFCLGILEVAPAALAPDLNTGGAVEAA